MMTIDEAIEITKKYNSCCNEVDADDCVSRICVDCESRYDEDEWKDVVKLLPNWLEELKRRREYDGEIIGSGVLNNAYNQGRADALDIDMDKPMHFTDEQKAWIKKYIIINAKRQREDTIDECIKVVEWGGYTLDIKRRIEQLKERTLAFTNNDSNFHLEPIRSVDEIKKK